MQREHFLWREPSTATLEYQDSQVSILLSLKTQLPDSRDLAHAWSVPRGCDSSDCRNPKPTARFLGLDSSGQKWYPIRYPAGVIIIRISEKCLSFMKMFELDARSPHDPHGVTEEQWTAKQCRDHQLIPHELSQLVAQLSLHRSYALPFRSYFARLFTIPKTCSLFVYDSQNMVPSRSQRSYGRSVG